MSPNALFPDAGSNVPIACAVLPGPLVACSVDAPKKPHKSNAAVRTAIPIHARDPMIGLTGVGRSSGVTATLAMMRSVRSVAG